MLYPSITASLISGGASWGRGGLKEMEGVFWVTELVGVSDGLEILTLLKRIDLLKIRERAPPTIEDRRIMTKMERILFFFIFNSSCSI
jgi:hypothetical protein